MFLQTAVSLAKAAGQLALVAGAVITISHARKGALKVPEGMQKWVPSRPVIHSAQRGRFVPDEFSYSHWMS